MTLAGGVVGVAQEHQVQSRGAAAAKTAPSSWKSSLSRQHVTAAPGSPPGPAPARIRQKVGAVTRACRGRSASTRRKIRSAAPLPHRICSMGTPLLPGNGLAQARGTGGLGSASALSSAPMTACRTPWGSPSGLMLAEKSRGCGPVFRLVPGHSRRRGSSSHSAPPKISALRTPAHSARHSKACQSTKAGRPGGCPAASTGRPGSPMVGLCYQLAKVIGIAGQLDPQGAGGHRLGLGGIGAFVLDPVPAEDPPGAAAVHMGQQPGAPAP